jgi:hypothetical protein
MPAHELLSLVVAPPLFLSFLSFPNIGMPSEKNKCMTQLLQRLFNLTAAAVVIASNTTSIAISASFKQLMR